ncbi:amino acid ABC transporter permease [Amycolatopsis saalfeldensis]|uniref:Amino acid ABC transporter membrane protein 1, PAAT family n=1 Tax=Amycolatopsis saalfeldensis TaxID=394193 RepID=A0A1H8X1C9_9PSEU|nr:amino acid ABC transporter permease [Amycolatopsis saalfeldensis]SEP33553.1 amino acid ABC transporter membrane protein 1, PAAT family [Amycolatopsis saalfeldensis]
MDVLLNNLDLFGPFFLTTIELFAIAAVGSLVFGTILAMLRVSPVPVFRAIGTTYVTIVRNTPLTLVFAFFVFAYPLLDIVKISYFTAAVVSLTVYTSAFICEVVRSGINTVPVGQAEAGRALGLNFGQILGQVVLPQALRSVVPPLISTLIALLKNSTIAGGFSVAEAGAIRSYISERGDNQMVALLWVALGFIILVAVLSFVQRNLEKRWSVAR